MGHQLGSWEAGKKAVARARRMKKKQKTVDVGCWTGKAATVREAREKATAEMDRFCEEHIEPTALVGGNGLYAVISCSPRGGWNYFIIDPNSKRFQNVGSRDGGCPTSGYETFDLADRRARTNLVQGYGADHSLIENETDRRDYLSWYAFQLAYKHIKVTLCKEHQACKEAKTKGTEGAPNFHRWACDHQYEFLAQAKREIIWKE